MTDDDRQRTHRDTRADLLEHLCAGGELMLTRRALKTEPELWSDPVSGKAFTAFACHWAIGRNLIRPRADGLFGDGQTYESEIFASKIALAKFLETEAAPAT